MKKWLLFCLAIVACSAINRRELGQGRASKIVVAASDYRTGVLIGPGLPEIPIHSDAIVRVSQGKFFVVNRLGQDNIQIINGQGRSENQFSVGRGLNPQDIAVIDESTAYISLYRSPTLLKVQLPDGKPKGKGVDFSSMADADGFPETTWMRRQGNQLFVVVQRLDTDHGHRPTDVSYVGVVDLATDELMGRISLTYVNPVTAVKNDSAGALYVGSAGRLGVGSLDGGIERLRPGTFTTEVIVTEAQLGGDLIDFELIHADRGVAVIARGAATRLIEFNVKTGAVGRTWADSNGYDFQEVLWDGLTLWAADRSPSGPSLRVFTADGIEGEPFPLTLPPYHLELAP